MTSKRLQFCWNDCIVLSQSWRYGTAFTSQRVHVVLKTWKCSEWRCLQNKDGVENTLGTTNYPFTLSCTNNYFVLKAASSSCRVVDLKVPDIYWGKRTFYRGFSSILNLVPRALSPGHGGSRDKALGTRLFDSFKIIFCPTSWYILKQLDNSSSLSTSDCQLGCASWTSAHRQPVLFV